MGMPEKETKVININHDSRPEDFQDAVVGLAKFFGASVTTQEGDGFVKVFVEKPE
jgi:hypothetical protein